MKVDPLYIELTNYALERGVKLTEAMREAGFSSNTHARWAKGATPSTMAVRRVKAEVDARQGAVK